MDNFYDNKPLVGKGWAIWPEYGSKTWSGRIDRTWAGDGGHMNVHHVQSAEEAAAHLLGNSLFMKDRHLSLLRELSERFAQDA